MNPRQQQNQRRSDEHAGYSAFGSPPSSPGGNAARESSASLSRRQRKDQSQIGKPVVKRFELLKLELLNNRKVRTI
jgi:hypothetical protein